MSELTPAERLSILREAGAVERSHVMPHHGSYTVGKHSFDMALLLLVLHPDPSINLLKACLVHDLGERFTGDVPHPAKMLDGEMAKRLARMEHAAHEKLGTTVDLTTEERAWLVGLDQIEFLLWLKDQLALGNANAATPYAAQLVALTTRDLPPELKDFLSSHQWQRHPDTFPK